MTHTVGRRAPLELPVTRQLAAILDRRWAGSGHRKGGWVFASALGRTGDFVKLTHFRRRISEAGGAKFYFHGLRRYFISVAERIADRIEALTRRETVAVKGGRALHPSL